MLGGRVLARIRMAWRIPAGFTPRSGAVLLFATVNVLLATALCAWQAHRLLPRVVAVPGFGDHCRSLLYRLGLVAALGLRVVILAGGLGLWVRRGILIA